MSRRQCLAFTKMIPLQAQHRASVLSPSASIREAEKTYKLGV